jgi:hypothetical protein
MQHKGTNTKSLTMLAVALALGAGLFPQPARGQSAGSVVDDFDDNNVSDWKPFVGNGATFEHRISSSRAKSGTLSMKMTYTVPTGGYAGVEKRFSSPVNWSGTSSLSVWVNGLGTGHPFRIQVYDAGGERFEYRFSVNFTGWQQVNIPFSSFTKAGWQPSSAKVNGVFDRAGVTGIALIPSDGKGTGAVYLDSAALGSGSGTTTTTPPPSTPTPTSTPAGTIIPLYSYPNGSNWSGVIAAKKAYPKVPMMAVVNPNNGPGYAVESPYLTGISQLTSAGIKVIGYVWTSYGQRPLADVQADIKRWRSQYPATTGIFLDEMDNRPGRESYYKQLTTYAKSHGFDLTMGNPGADTQPSYIGTVDLIFIYENAGLPSTTALGGWHSSHDKKNFGIIPYAVPSMSRTFVSTARQHVGYIYLQNDTMPNPWDTVPPYFHDLVAALAS